MALQISFRHSLNRIFAPAREPGSTADTPAAAEQRLVDELLRLPPEEWERRLEQRRRYARFARRQRLIEWETQADHARQFS